MQGTKFPLGMLSTFDKTTHLLEISFPDRENAYLVVVNAFTHPKSIKENSYFEVCQLADVQLHLITKNHVENVMGERFWNVEEIALMSEPPFGEALYSSAPQDNLEILVIRDKHGKPVIAGGLIKEAFIEEFIREGDELYGEYSATREEVINHPVEFYRASYIPTEAYKDIFDMDRYFNMHTRYDYQNEMWVSPK